MLRLMSSAIAAEIARRARSEYDDMVIMSHNAD